MDQYSSDLTAQQVVAEYDLRRRLILMQRLGWLLLIGFFLGLGALDAVYILSGAKVGQNVIITTAVLQFVLPLVSISGALLAKRGYAKIALATLIFCFFAPVLFIHIIYISNGKFDIQLITLFSSYTFIITLAGILGNTRSVVATTIALFIVELLVASRIPAGELSFQQLIIVLLNTYTQQVGMMVIMIVFYISYLSTLRELANSLEQIEKARKLDDLKNQFISSVNHELRTPVMAMLANIEGLYLTADQATPERRKRMIERAYTAGLNLRTLLESILDSRRLDQGVRDFTPEPVYIAEVLQTSIESVAATEVNLTERPLQIDVPSHIAIWGDKIRFQQIITNLLTNAMKYSDAGTPIEITAQPVAELETTQNRRRRSTQKNTPMIEISVRDWGFGIPPDQAPLLFQRFVRLPRDLASTRIGNGLGLYLCKVLAEAMDGTIRVESTGVPNEGSNFIMRFPVPPHALILPITRKLGESIDLSLEKE